MSGFGRISAAQLLRLKTPTPQVKLRCRDGQTGISHLTLQVNGVGVPFLVDTGASEIVLTQDDARRVGFDTATLDYFGRANTANGTVSIAFVRLETVQLGEIMDTGVRATVNSAPMEGSLLGMSYLQRFAEVSIRGNTLILTR